MFDETETIDGNPKSWAAWKREAERLQKIIDEMTANNHPANGPVSLDDDEPIGGVTHWMPLPEPPQEVK